MKKIFLLIFTMLLVGKSFSQSITIEEGLEPLGTGYNKAYRIYIPHTELKVVTKKWIEFLKKNNAKVKTSKSGAITGSYAVINGLGADSIQVYSRIDELQNGVLLASVFDRNGGFISPSSTSIDAKLLGQLLKDWATEQSRDALFLKIKSAEKSIVEKTKDQKSLEEDNKSLLESNEKMKKQIAENERKVIDNSSAIEKVKAEIIDNGSTLETLKQKLKEL